LALVLVSLISLGESELILHLPDGTNETYIALPQQFDGNQISFDPITAEAIMPNGSHATQGRFVFVPDTTDSWTMEHTLIHAMTLNPRAIIVYSSTFLLSSPGSSLLY